MALPRNNRIVQERDFSIILKQGKTVHGSFFFIKGRKNDNLQERRFGIILPSKAVKSAVKRNIIKRQFSEVFRMNPDVARGYDIVCYIRKDCSEYLLEAREEFTKALHALPL